MKFLLTAILLILSCLLFAQTPQWQWTVSAGGTAHEQCNGLATDAQGNVYVTGTYVGTMTFGSTQLTSAGDIDVYVAKLSPAGNWLWAVSAGGTGNDPAGGIGVDASGNAYITGSFVYTATFGSYSLTSSGEHDVFVAKLDTNGNFLWAVKGGGMFYDQGNSLAVNATGVVVTGFVNTDAVFGTHQVAGIGDTDIFIAKLDSGGNWLWAKIAGGVFTDEGFSVALDNAGNVYATGYFEGDATFGGSVLTSQGNNNVFIAILGPSGVPFEAHQAGGIGNTVGTSIAVDPSGNICLTGYFDQSASFGPFTLFSVGDFDAFVAKLNSSATFQWAYQAGGTAYDAGNDLVTDNLGNVYITGAFSGQASFGGYNLTSFGGYDACIVKMAADGSLPWVVHAGGTGTDLGMGICFTGNGNIYCAGNLENTATFGDDIIPNDGLIDIFVTKLYAANSANEDNAIPTAPQSILYDAYPNPFHRGQSTRIKTQLAPGESGTLTVYNLLGRRVADYTLTTGSHETRLDSATLPSGIYFYKLRTPTTTTAKKLVLLK